METPNPHDFSQLIYTIKELKNALGFPNPWLPLYSAIAGGLIASIPNGVGALLKYKNSQKALETAILSEISHIAIMIRKRRIPELLKRNQADLSEINGQIESTRYSEDQVLNFQTLPFPLTVADSHFKIYTANLDKLGIIDKNKLPKIVHFYGLIESLILDTSSTGGLGGTGDGQHYSEAIQLLEEALECADKLTIGIEQKS